MDKNLPPGTHNPAPHDAALSISPNADPSLASVAHQALEPYKKLPDNKGKFSIAYTLQVVLTVLNQSCIALIVVIRFKSVGSAPIMKQNFFKITSSHKFQAVVQFLRKELRWKQGDPLVSHPCAPMSGHSTRKT